MKLKVEKILQNIVNKANSVLEESKSNHQPPKKKLLCTIVRLPISLAVVINIILMISVPTVTILLEYGVIPAKKTGFYCEDPLYSHEYKGDTITPITLGVSAFVLPVLTILLVEFLAHESFQKMNFRRAWISFQECLVGTTMVLLLTSIAKMLVGEHRPHFFDICQPDTARNCTKGQFVATFECTNTKESYLNLVDSSLSFPSGHSSISWFLGMLLAYIIQTRLVTVNTGTLMKPFLISVCLTWSLVCSLTRITDRRHHWWDVLAGATIGILYSLVTMKLLRRKMLAMETKLLHSGMNEIDENYTV